MRWIILALILTVGLTGCSLLPGKNIARANQKNWEVIGPRYRTYTEKDTTLDAATKKRRQKTLDMALELAKKMVEKGK